MKRRRWFLGLLILSLLSCNYLNRMIATPTATLPPPTATLTATASATPTETPVPLVPAYIPPECTSRPLATLAPDFDIPPTQETGSIPHISKFEQFRILNDIASIVREVYVYPDFNGRDWTEIVARYKAKIDAGLNAEQFYVEMENMIEELGDEHSFFLSPLGVEMVQAEQKGENSFVGIGVYSNLDFANHRVVVISTYPDSSAAYAGIQAHDSILKVDGRPVIDDNRTHLRGPECSAVVLTVQSPGQEPRDLMLVRHVLKGNLRIDARLVPTTDGSRIGYIFIPTFFDETIPQQIEDALNNFGTLDGLILDVRMNSGGSNTVANPILSFFTSGRLGQFVSRFESRTLSLEADPIQNSQTVPLVVMVSRDTISYGEIFAGIMRDSRGAKITGETSLGNVEVMHPYEMEDGSELWIAAERFFPAHSDENWEETGIVPDLQAYADWGSFSFSNDPSITAALTLLGHQ